MRPVSSSLPAEERKVHAERESEVGMGTKPATLCGSDCWQLRNMLKKNVSEMRMLRWTSDNTC